MILRKCCLLSCVGGVLSFSLDSEDIQDKSNCFHCNTETIKFILPYQYFQEILCAEMVRERINSPWHDYPSLLYRESAGPHSGEILINGFTCSYKKCNRKVTYKSLEIVTYLNKSTPENLILRQIFNKQPLIYH